MTPPGQLENQMSNQYKPDRQFYPEIPAEVPDEQTKVTLKNMVSAHRIKRIAMNVYENKFRSRKITIKACFCAVDVVKNQEKDISGVSLTGLGMEATKR